MKMKNMSDMSNDEFKTEMLAKAKDDYEFFKVTRGHDEALKIALEFVFNTAHNRGMFDATK